MSFEHLSSSAFYEHLFRNSADAVFILEGKRFIECNPAATRLFGCERDNVIGEYFINFSPENQARGSSDILAEKYFDDALKGEPQSFDWIFSTPARGTVLTNVFTCRTQGDTDLLQLIIKETSADDLPLGLTENKFANHILNLFPGLFFMYEVTRGFESARLIRFNRKWYSEKLGYGPHERPGGFPEFIFSPDAVEKTGVMLQELKLNKAADFETDLRHKEGYDIPYLFVANLFKAGDHMFFTGIGIDISERKYSEIVLRQSEEYFKNIFNSSTDGILVLDLEFQLLNANDAIFRMFDYKFEDVVFHNVLDFLPAHSRQVLMERSVMLMNNEQTSPIELEIKKSTGEPVPVEINSIIIKYGGRTGLLTTVRDLTERKMLEKRIFNSEIRSEEKERERFAKELHDGLGPILSTCKIYLHSLNEMLAGREELLKISDRALTLIDDALGSIKEISNNLSPHVLRNFGLVQAVIAFTHNLETVSTLKFEVHYNYEERLNEVIEFTAYRIITELINNSVKYADATLIVIDIVLNRPYLSVSYSDNGMGFDMNDVKRAKKGFGLTNIETRISKFNGLHSYETSPGNGVKVAFALDLNQSDR